MPRPARTRCAAKGTSPAPEPTSSNVSFRKPLARATSRSNSVVVRMPPNHALIRLRSIRLRAISADVPRSSSKSSEMTQRCIQGRHIAIGRSDLCYTDQNEIAHPGGKQPLYKSIPGGQISPSHRDRSSSAIFASTQHTAESHSGTGLPRGGTAGITIGRFQLLTGNRSYPDCLDDKASHALSGLENLVVWCGCGTLATLLLRNIRRPDQDVGRTGKNRQSGEQRFFSCGFGHNPMGLPFSDRAEQQYISLVRTFSLPKGQR